MRFLLVLAVAGACLGQQYEIGGAAGAGFVKNLNVTGAAGTATTGFKSGVAASGLVGHNLYPNLSGEVRYTFLKSDLKLASGGTTAAFSGMAHAIHYDLLIHPVKGRSKVLPFGAIGGGVKIFRGTGTEASYQPLGNYAYLTKTQEAKPMISAGGGVKIQVSERVWLRAEFRDYITPFPKKVIAPASGAKISGWVHDIVPIFGISYTF